MKVLQGLILGGAVGGSSSLSVCGCRSGIAFSCPRRPSDAPLLRAKRRGLSLAPSENSSYLLVSARPSATTRMVGPVARVAGREKAHRGGETVGFRSETARAYHERRRKALGAWTEERRGRDLCERCRRARKVQRSCWFVHCCDCYSR